MKKLIIWGVSVTLLLGAAIGGGYSYFSAKASPLPATIKEQLNFNALLPKAGKSGFRAQKSSFKYLANSGDEKILSFIAQSPDNKITLTEQAYPEILVFDKLVGTLNQYAEVQTKVGKVALTKPKNLGGSQTAVLNQNNQVLLFAKPDHDLTDDQWRQFFNSLKIVN